MTRVLRWVAVVVAAMLAAGSGAAIVSARQTLDQATGAIEGAELLRKARIDLADAQEGVGKSNLEEAVEGARIANAAAEKVKLTTLRLLQRVEGALADVESLTATSEASGQRVAVSRARTKLAAALLSAISGEQTAASRATHSSNRYLRRILKALRRSNRALEP
jgi:hypothetical protein